jgi:hypothetical protein
MMYYEYYAVDALRTRFFGGWWWFCIEDQETAGPSPAEAGFGPDMKNRGANGADDRGRSDGNGNGNG